MLKNMIRPVLMGRFSKNRNQIALSNESNLILKLNHLLLVPLIIWATLVGNQITSLMSRGKYSEAGWIFVALLGISFINGYNNQILQPQTNALEKNHLLLIVEFIPALFLIPTFYYMKHLGLVGFFLFKYLGIFCRDASLVYLLKKAQIIFRLDWIGTAKIFLSFLLTTVMLKQLVPEQSTSLEILLAGIASFGLFYAIVIPLKIFNIEEREIINKTFPLFEIFK